ncbi:MAG TPA: hypothetical protein VGH95_02610 [Candidatus Aquirickettsiella sp.]
MSTKIKIDNPLERRLVSDIAVAGMSSVVRGHFDVENLATQLITDTAAYVAAQQMQTKQVSDEYHQSKKASQGAGHITQTAIEQQWESQLINDAEFTANTQLPSITFDVNNSYVAQQLGQRVGEEVSHFYYPTPPPRNPSGFWQRVEQRYENVLEHRALIAEGRAAANSEVMSESLGHVSANQQHYLDLGYTDSVAETRAGWIAAAELPLPSVAKGIMQASSLMNRWGIFSRNSTEEPSNLLGNGEERLVSTGGRQIKSVNAWNKAERQAAEFYESIRSNPSNMDVSLISKNVGMPEFQVQRIKQHLFYDTHKLDTGVGRFSPDIEIADAWTRLQNGNFVKHDLQLLQHEYFEARFKGIFKTDYITAHNAAVDTGRFWKPEEFITTHEMSWRP